MSGPHKTTQTEDPIFPDARATDLIIPIMGPPGVGKSTFVNTLYGSQVVQVGHGLRSCTKVLEAVTIEPRDGPFKGRRLVIVDTPSFNSTDVSDIEILRRIADWLASSYKDKMQLAGVIYLFETAQSPMSEPNRRDREIFQKLCGNDALSMVVVGTTKWETLNDGTVRERERNLRESFWEGPSNKPSEIHRVRNTYESAWDIINHLAQEGINCTILQIQRELVDFQKLIPDTEAGKCVYSRGHSGSRHGKRDYLKISLVRRILMLFGVE